MEVGREVVGLWLMLACVVGSVHGDPDYGSALEEGDGEALVNTPQTRCEQEMAIQLGCFDTSAIVQLDIEAQLQELGNILSDLQNITASSPTTLHSLEDKVAALEERVDSLLQLVTSLS